MLHAIHKFIKTEGASGFLLLVALLIAIGLANSPLSNAYNDIVNLSIRITMGPLIFNKPLLLWINDGLMAIFFMLISLEMKREMTEGELSKPTQLSLPFIAAIGGVLTPALIYLGFNLHHTDTLIGWPIPTTTDVAFTLAIIIVLRKYIPVSLKAFIVALSIIDDIMAIVIIALFYTSTLSWLSLTLASIGVIALIILNRLGVKRIMPYILIGVFIWVCVLKSGVHATLASVVVGLCIPTRHKNDRSISPLRKLETALHPWVAYLILPLFVLANGNINFSTMKFNQFLEPVPLGIASGLFLGKLIGVSLFSWLTIKLKFAQKPTHANWGQIIGVAALTGIGFTMSFFLTSLAFYATPYEILAKQGVLLGSLFSALLGALIIRLASDGKNYLSYYTATNKE